MITINDLILYLRDNDNLISVDIYTPPIESATSIDITIKYKYWKSHKDEYIRKIQEFLQRHKVPDFTYGIKVYGRHEIA